MKNIRKSIVINILIFVLELISMLWMIFGTAVGNLSSNGLAMFKFFTIDSNFIMGIIALVCAIKEIKVLKGEIKDLSSLYYILKIMGTVGVTLTMLVTIFFLAPTMGLAVCYAGPNLLLHIINPVLSILVFTLYEKNNLIKYKHTFTATLPLVFYSIYYISLTLIHTTDGIIESGYDWYGFFMYGISSIFIVLPIVYLITYLISLCLWKLNKSK